MISYRDLLSDLVRYAQNSPDPSTQNAASLFIPGTFYGGSGGAQPLFETYSVNEFPAGVKNKKKRWDRPKKYAFVEHAERNAIFKACLLGISTPGLGLACPWAACADCARAIVQTGISILVRHKDQAANERWDESIGWADEILLEAGVKIVDITGPLAVDLQPIRRNGSPYLPQ